MKIAFPIVLTLLIACADTKAQSVSTLIGARSAGVGYTSETLSDEWSLFNNVGGLAQVRQLSVAFAADVHPALEGAGRVALVITSPVKKSTVAAGLFRFGDNVYNEQVIAAGFSNKMGIASLGLKLNYIQYQAEGFGTHSVFSFSFGGIATLTPTLTVGAFITNINQPVISKAGHEKLPTLLNAGLGYKASDKFLFVTGVQKDLDFNSPTVKAGIEFSVHPRVIFRTGVNVHPDTFWFGFSLKKRHLQIDYAAQHNQELNFGHQISVGFFFPQPKHRIQSTPAPKTKS